MRQSRVLFNALRVLSIPNTFATRAINWLHRHPYL